MIAGDVLEIWKPIQAEVRQASNGLKRLRIIEKKKKLTDHLILLVHVRPIRSDLS